MTLITRILKECDAEMIGGKKHRKYKLPNGRIFSMPDVHPVSHGRTGQNILASLRRMMAEGMSRYPKPETT